MKKITLILLSFLMVSTSYSQIGIGTNNPDASAALAPDRRRSGETDDEKGRSSQRPRRDLDLA